MKALLLVAHGSRREKSNEEVVDMSNKLKIHCDGEFEIVKPAFLELAEVLIPDGIKQCVNEGATSIIILPYFLNSGRHVVEDIPNIVNAEKKIYPDISIKISSHLGASEMMMDVLISNANKSV
ncbi:MAG: CbiX/SirB N-terminal domain-containing protein [Gammaproteobacteria bacterium]|nr:CbiX/SirB N-terminal domain-containing protein [Gammaproteobacteria bacterium]